MTEGLRTSVDPVETTATGATAVSGAAEIGLAAIVDANIEVEVTVVVDAVNTETSATPGAVLEDVDTSGLFVDAPMIPLVREPGRALCRACMFFIRLARASRRAFEAASSMS